MKVSLFDSSNWNKPIANVDAKMAIASVLVSKVRPGQIVGVGSGSTCFLTVQKIAALESDVLKTLRFVCTSIEIELLCTSLNMNVIPFRNVSIDWHFDGADEINSANEIIKGRGGAFFREKLLFYFAKEVIIVADRSKYVKSLCDNHPLPLEVHPDALSSVAKEISNIGAAEVALRLAEGKKDGPVITEQGNVILDTKWEHLDIATNSRLIQIPGIIETGLFFRDDTTFISE